MGDKIEVGDFVNVYFERADAIFDYEILYIPQATGDSWHLKHKNGMLCYVQFFECMERLEKETP